MRLGHAFPDFPPQSLQLSLQRIQFRTGNANQLGSFRAHARLPRFGAFRPSVDRQGQRPADPQRAWPPATLDDHKFIVASLVSRRAELVWSLRGRGATCGAAVRPVCGGLTGLRGRAESHGGPNRACTWMARTSQLNRPPVAAGLRVWRRPGSGRAGDAGAPSRTRWPGPPGSGERGAAVVLRAGGVPPGQVGVDALMRAMMGMLTVTVTIPAGLFR